ncbi:MAG: hypothetical protein ABIP01_01300 [Candidatus Limnocylindria bacterium]
MLRLTRLELGDPSLSGGQLSGIRVGRCLRFARIAPVLGNLIGL